MCVFTLLESDRLARMSVSSLRVTTGSHLIIFITGLNMSAFPKWCTNIILLYFYAVTITV